MNKPASAAKTAAAAKPATGELDLDQVLHTPNGKPCQKQGDAGLEDLTLGDYVYMMLTQRQNDPTRKMDEIIKAGILCERVSDDKSRRISFTVKEKDMILDSIKGQPTSLQWGLISVLDPQQIENLR